MNITTIEDLNKATNEERLEAIQEVYLMPKIESYLEDLPEREQKPGKFYPSDIGGTSGKSLCGTYTMGCGRLMYYRYLGNDPVSRWSAKDKLIFGTGSKVHEQIQHYLDEISKKNNAYLFRKEVRIDPFNNKVAGEYSIYSNTDGVFEISSSDKRLKFGLEIKSTNDTIFSKLKQAEVYHIVQSTIYMACLDLPFMNILYYNKNNSSVLEFPITFDVRIWDAVKSKINYVKEHAASGNPPDREDSWFCKKCIYYHLCSPQNKVDDSKLSQLIMKNNVGDGSGNKAVRRVPRFLKNK